jgi:high-affinity Fe2+/Pb2+ permease
MKRTWIIARMTFREAIRRRIVLTGLVLGLLFLTVFSLGFRMVYVNAYDRASEETGAFGSIMVNEGVNVFRLVA